MYFPEEFIKNIFEKMDVECSQHAIEELDNELFNYGTYLSEKKNRLQRQRCDDQEYFGEHT